jgi:hypothetical protein
MCDSGAGLVGCGPVEPPSIFPSRPCSSIRKRSAGLQRKSHTRELPRSIAWLRSRRAITRIIVAIAPIVCQAAVSTAFVPSAVAHAATRSESIDRFAEFIDEASGRFAVPARWIRAVMQVESGRDQHATSSRGAKGLMQLTPGTWVELSVRYGLGLDPFDPRDNILAATAYLKEMFDRFGSAGFLAAYHTGPSRFDQHLATGRPLPTLTLRRSRHCSATGRENTPHFASNVRFLGRKLRCLSSAWTRGDRRSVCIRYAETSQFNCELIGRFSHRNSYPLVCSCDNHVRTYSDDCKCILSQSALRSSKPAARELDAGDERPRRAG